MVIPVQVVVEFNMPWHATDFCLLEHYGQRSVVQRMIKHTCYFNTPLAEAPVLRRKQARRNQLGARPAIKAAGLLTGSDDTAMQSKLMQSLPNYFAAKKRNGRKQKAKEKSLITKV